MTACYQTFLPKPMTAATGVVAYEIGARSIKVQTHARTVTFGRSRVPLHLLHGSMRDVAAVAAELRAIGYREGRDCKPII